MGIYRVMSVLNHVSGLPRDQVVNTFHFYDGAAGGDNDIDIPDAGPATSADAEQCASAVEAFWNGGASATDRIQQWYSNQLSGTGRIKVYDVAAPKFTPPLVDNPITLLSMGTAQALPGEVALCGSFKAAPVGGTPPARLRGRIYAGPLNVNAVVVSSRPALAPRTALLAAIKRLLDWDEGVDQHVVFGVLSRPKPATVNKDGSPNPARPGTFYNAEEAWVDDEFDTIRRRGLRANGRITALD